MIIRDTNRCANEGCPNKRDCNRFSDDATSAYANYCIGIDGKCDGYVRKPRVRVGRKVARVQHNGK